MINFSKKKELYLNQALRLAECAEASLSPQMSVWAATWQELALGGLTSPAQDPELLILVQVPKLPVPFQFITNAYCLPYLSAITAVC